MKSCLLQRNDFLLLAGTWWARKKVRVWNVWVSESRWSALLTLSALCAASTGRMHRSPLSLPRGRKSPPLPLSPAPRILPPTARTGRTLSPRAWHRQRRTPSSERKRACSGTELLVFESRQWNGDAKKSRWTEPLGRLKSRLPLVRTIRLGVCLGSRGASGGSGSTHRPKGHKPRDPVLASP